MGKEELKYVKRDGGKKSGKEGEKLEGDGRRQKSIWEGGHQE